MITRSRSGARISSSGRSVIVGIRYSAPTRVARSNRLSQTACTWLPGWRAKLRTRLGPQYPQPITPARTARPFIAAPPAALRRAARIEQHDRQRPPQVLEAQPQRPPPHVLQIQLAHLPVGEQVAPRDLPQARDPRLDPQPVELPVVVGFELVHQRRPRTHQAHFAPEYEFEAYD